MSTSAIVLMVSSMGLVISATAYFFWKVLRTPTKKGDDGERPEGFYEAG